MDRGRVTEVTVSTQVDFKALAEKWRDLEARAEPSFFQSWTWTGCLARERFDRPVLVEARDGGIVVALALFNRRGGALHLGESGDPGRDSPYIEYNGVLAERGREADLSSACLRAVRPLSPWGWLTRPRVIVSGVQSSDVFSINDTHHVYHPKTLVAPWIDFSALNGDYLDALSANTRQQLRRSDRHYQAIGPLSVERADSIPQALAFLDALKDLHQASWIARGKPGAFAGAFFNRFHRALIERGFPRGEIDLLRIAAGAEIVGYLYNFRHRGHVLAYQSGFDYAGGGRHGKPGLTSHHRAIRQAIGQGAARYDFLAGDDRYKRSLANREDLLSWIELRDQVSARGIADGAKDRLRRLMARGGSARA